tara:strand:- start:910 stop:2130 length:1221 start_codon:yes stop_codon:yes gene_type:complete
MKLLYLVIFTLNDFAVSIDLIPQRLINDTFDSFDLDASGSMDIKEFMGALDFLCTTNFAIERFENAINSLETKINSNTEKIQENILQTRFQKDIIDKQNTQLSDMNMTLKEQKNQFHDMEKLLSEDVAALSDELLWHEDILQKSVNEKSERFMERSEMKKENYYVRKAIQAQKYNDRASIKQYKKDIKDIKKEDIQVHKDNDRASMKQYKKDMKDIKKEDIQAQKDNDRASMKDIQAQKDNYRASKKEYKLRERSNMKDDRASVDNIHYEYAVEVPNSHLHTLHSHNPHNPTDLEHDISNIYYYLQQLKIPNEYFNLYEPKGNTNFNLDEPKGNTNLDEPIGNTNFNLDELKENIEGKVQNMKENVQDIQSLLHNIYDMRSMMYYNIANFYDFIDATVKKYISSSE